MMGGVIGVNRIVATPSGARVMIIQRNSGHLAVRDDGLPIFSASSRWDVEDYVRRYGDVIQPSPEGKRLYF